MVVSISVVTLLVNTASSWLRGLAYAAGKGIVGKVIDDQIRIRHMQLALKNAAELGLGDFQTPQEQELYLSVLSILAEDDSEALRTEALELFTLSGKPNIRQLSEKYNLAKRLKAKATGQVYTNIDAAPYLTSFFNALVNQLFRDSIFHDQIRDALSLRAERESADTLRQLEVTIQSLEERLMNLSRLYDVLVPGYTPEAFARDVETYVAYITGQRFHDFLGMVPDKGADSTPPLDEIYVPVRVALEAETSEGDSIPQEYDEPYVFDESRRGVVGALEQTRYLVVLGGPGSGKSMVTRYLTWSHAQVHQSDPVTDSQADIPILPTQPIPLRIELRLFSEARQKKLSYSFLSYATEVLLGREDVAIKEEMFQQLLERRAMLLIFDGLDEVSTLKERQQLRDEIQELANRYPSNYILVTSRPVGYDIARFRSPQFQQGTILEFNNEQIRTFINGWYHAVLRNPTLSADMRQRRDEFYQAVTSNPSLRRIATNPLLLTQMATIHRSFNSLPNSRAQVYEKCAQLLLGTYDEAKGTDERWNKLRMTRDDWSACMGHLGFVLHQHAQDEGNSRRAANRQDIDTDVPEQFLRNEIEVYLHEERLLSDRGKERAEAALFLSLIIEKAGLIVERGKDNMGQPVYGFVHRTFQEFFAAADINRRGTLNGSKVQIRDFLEEHLHDPHWREVILLLFAKLSASRQLVTALLGQVLVGTSRRSLYSSVVQQDLDFVAGCLAEDVSVDVDLAQRVADDLAKLVRMSPFPTQSLDALDSLGGLSEAHQYSEFGWHALRTLVLSAYPDLDIEFRIEAAAILITNASAELPQRTEMVDWLRQSAVRQDISFALSLYAAQVLYRSVSSEAEVIGTDERKLAVETFVSLMHRPDLTFEQAREVGATLYRITPSGTEDEHTAIRLLLEVARGHGLTAEQALVAAMAVYNYSASDSEEEREARDLLRTLARRPDLTVEQALDVATTLYDLRTPDSEDEHSAEKRSEEEREARALLWTLARRPDLTAEQALDVATSLYDWSTEGSEEEREARDLLNTLSRRHDVSSDQLLKVAEEVYQINAPGSSDRNWAIQRLLELARRSDTPFDYALDALRYLYQESPIGSDEERDAISTMSTLARRGDLTTEQLVELEAEIYRICSPDSTEGHQALQQLIALSRNTQLGVMERLIAAETLYDITPFDSKEETEAIELLRNLVREPNLSAEETLQAAKTAFQFTSAELDEPLRLYILDVLLSLAGSASVSSSLRIAAALAVYERAVQYEEKRQQSVRILWQLIQDQAIPTDQRLQAAIVPFIARQWNYRDLVEAVRMVSSVLHRDDARAFFLDQWRSGLSQVHLEFDASSPTRGRLHVMPSAAPQDIPSVFELANEDVLPVGLRDYLYELLRVSVQEFARVVVPHP